MAAATITTSQFNRNLRLTSPTDALPTSLVFNNPSNRYLKLELVVDSVVIVTRDIGQVSSFIYMASSAEVDDILQAYNQLGLTHLWRLRSFSDSGYTTQDGTNQDYTMFVRIDGASVNAWSAPTFSNATLESVDKDVEVRDIYNNLLTTSSTNTLIGSSDPILLPSYSKIKATVEVADKATANYYATMEAYSAKVEVGGGNSWVVTGRIPWSNTLDVELFTIDNVNDEDIEINAIDSRGQHREVNIPFDLVIDYEPIELFQIALLRDNDTETTTKLSFSGTMWDNYFGSGSSTPTGTENTLVVEYRYKETIEAWGVQTWTDISGDVSVTSGVIEYEEYINGDLGSSGFDTEKSYNIEVRAYDLLNAVIVEATLDKGTPLMHLHKDGMAIKKLYDESIGGNLQVKEDVYIGGNIDSKNTRTGWNKLDKIPTYLSSTGITIAGKLFDVIKSGTFISFEQAITPVAHYRFEDNTDSSINANTLSAIGDPTYTSGYYGNAVAFDGNDAFSSITSDWDLFSALCINVWFKSSNTASQGIVHNFGIQTSTNNRHGFQLYTNSSGQINFELAEFGTVANVDYKVIQSSLSVTDGYWHNIVAQWDGSFMELWIDGELKSREAWDTAPNYLQHPVSNTYIRVGCLANSGSNTNFLTGQLDDLVILDRALKTEEIKNIYSLYKEFDNKVRKDFKVKTISYDGTSSILTVEGDNVVENSAITSPLHTEINHYPVICRADNTSFNVANATVTEIVLNHFDSDDYKMFNPVVGQEIIIPRSGYYTVIGNARIGVIINSNRVLSRIKHNGSPLTNNRGRMEIPSSGTAPALEVQTADLYLEKGDNLVVDFYHVSGATRAIEASITVKEER